MARLQWFRIEIIRTRLPTTHKQAVRFHSVLHAITFNDSIAFNSAGMPSHRTCVWIASTEVSVSFFSHFFFDNLNSNTHDCIDIVVYLISIKQPQSPWTGVFLWWVYVRLPESGDVWNWQIDSLQFAHFFRQFYFFTSTNYKNHASAWIWLTKTVSQLPWIALTIRLAVTASSTQWETRSPNIYLIQCTHSDLSDRKITLKSKWAAVRRRFIVPKHLRTCENVYFAHHRPLLYC